MVGVQGQVLGHLVRRGIDAVRENEQANIIMTKLRHDAELYEKSGPDMQLKPMQFMPVAITFVILMVALASIRYTIGDLIASLTIIESPTTTAIIEDKPPAYTDEPDAPLEKDVPIAEMEAGVDVTLIPNKPVTSKITTTIGHLNLIGGFRARWRGLGWSIIYHLAHGGLANFISALFHLGLFGHALVYCFASVATARLHMAWTHAMISYPSKKAFGARILPRKQCRAILLPTLVSAVAQQATILIPIGVALALDLKPDDASEVAKNVTGGNCRGLLMLVLRVAAVLSSAAFIALAVLIPANAALIRIEAALLPEGEETIVPFDRRAIVGDLDLNARGTARAVFKQAWRSFSCAARWRLIKLYLKLALIQFTTTIIAMHVIVAEIYVFGGEKLALFVRSASAQIQLEAVDAYEHQHGN